MSFWNALVAIVAIIAFMEIRRARYHAQVAVAEDRATRQLVPAPRAGDQDTPREAELERELADLRTRLEVLERITTDAHSLQARNAGDIAREIESLRG